MVLWRVLSMVRRRTTIAGPPQAASAQGCTTTWNRSGFPAGHSPDVQRAYAIQPSSMLGPHVRRDSL